jgi:hypothetical protein
MLVMALLVCLWVALAPLAAVFVGRMLALRNYLGSIRLDAGPRAAVGRRLGKLSAGGVSAGGVSAGRA